MATSFNRNPATRRSREKRRAESRQGALYRASEDLRYLDLDLDEPQK
jgi:hypothetical protein